VTADGDALMRRYAAALHDAVADPGEHSLSAAYELGREAVRAGLSVLDLAAAHNDAVAAELAAAADLSAARRTAQATGAFFLESLSAYELLQRVLHEGQERANLEQRQTTLLRRLSDFLGDASLAIDANASVHEVLQLVAEHALDFVDAAACRASLGPSGSSTPALEATAASDPAGLPDTTTIALLADLRGTLGGAGPIRLTADELVEHVPGASFAWLAAALTALDGRQIGDLQLYGGPDAGFSEVDEAVVAQLAHLASATFERMELYR
jgi:Phosphoserine phosphatase RsbU, N-terminal domain